MKKSDSKLKHQSILVNNKLMQEHIPPYLTLLAHPCPPLSLSIRSFAVEAGSMDNDITTPS